VTPDVIRLTAVRKVYGSGDAAVEALRGIDLTIAAGDYVAIMGASGSGKSTLMNVLGCLDVPTSGTYQLDGVDVTDLDDDSLARVRGRRIGFVFQSFNLVPRMSAVANVELPMTYAGVRAGVRRERALAALQRVSLADRASHHPSQLSGGQQQRVAIARALVMAPALVLADEPTGNLDSASSHEVMSILDELNSGGRTVVLITHEDDVAEHAARRLRLVDGRIVSDVRSRPLGMAS
jgi:putative ABC transport system ATP-binding protein